MDAIIEEQVERNLCTRCIKKLTVTDLSQLKAGDHISILGRISRCKKWSPYMHHAIVSETGTLSGSSGKFKVIGFQDCEHELCPYLLKNCGNCRCRKGLRVQEEEIDVNLDLSPVKIILYKGTDRTKESYYERVETAKNLLKSNPEYNVYVFNCEHFCHVVCAGVPDSRQIKHLFSVSTFVCITVFQWLCFFLLFVLLPIASELGMGYELGVGAVFMLMFWAYKTISYGCLVMLCLKRSSFRSVNKEVNLVNYRCTTCMVYTIIEMIISGIILLFYPLVNSFFAWRFNNSLFFEMGLSLVFVLIAIHFLPKLLRKLFDNC